MSSPSPLTPDQVRKVAALSRLTLSEADVATYTRQLGSILDHMRQLAALDLTDVEPMTSPIESVNRLADDTPGLMLTNQQVMDLAPPRAADPPFVRVPKVLGGGESA